MGQTAEDIDWISSGKAKGQWRAMVQAAVRRGWTNDMERDKVSDRVDQGRRVGRREPWLLLVMFGHTSIALYKEDGPTVYVV